MSLYESDEIERDEEPPERLVKCLGCGHRFYEVDGRCDTCDFYWEQESS